MAKRKPKRILVLGAGAAQLGLLEAARERGLYVIAVDRDASAPGFRFADRRAIVSVEDEPDVERLAGAERVQGIIAPGLDWPTGIAARVADRLGLPHPLPATTAPFVASKVRQRERWAEADVPQPETALCRLPQDAVDAADWLGYPVVVKPPDRQGGRGLSVAGDAATARAAAEEALAESRTGSCLVEELIEGPELTVSAFSLDGRFVPLTVTDRLHTDGAFGVAHAHAWPSALPPARLGATISTAARAVAALDIRNGPSYTQLRLAPDGPRVLEVAARLGGGHDADLCETALGVDLNGLALKAALGEHIHPSEVVLKERVRGACVRFLVAPEGELGEVRGLDEAEEAEGVVRVRIHRAVGHTFGPLRRAADRAGAILAVGGSRDQALERAARAAELVTFAPAGAAEPVAP